MYAAEDVRKLGLPMFDFGRAPATYYSKSRLRKELKIALTEEQLNNPHGFGRGHNGYYPLYDYKKLKKEWQNGNHTNSSIK